MVETTGVEPVVPEGRRIYSPLGLPIFLHLHICYIESHSAPLTTLFLSIQDAPGMNPADPLGCLYLSIQIESVFQYNLFNYIEIY